MQEAPEKKAAVCPQREPLQKKSPRYGLIDSLRGFVIINMIAFHLLYDLKYVMGLPVPWYTIGNAYWWQQGICWSFVLISGFCWKLGRHPVRRGLTVSVCGLVIMAVVWVFLPSERIFFGVLSFLGLAMLLLVPLERLFRKCPAWPGLAIFLLLFAFSKGLANGYLGFFGTRLVELPKAWYANYATTILGLPFPGFVSSDYVPLFPGFFLFAAGYFLWRLLKEPLERSGLFVRECGPLSWLGRNSLVIYMLHQPVLMGAVLLLF